MNDNRKHSSHILSTTHYQTWFPVQQQITEQARGGSASGTVMFWNILVKEDRTRSDSNQYYGEDNTG